jgi:hypothetical protein
MPPPRNDTRNGAAAACCPVCAAPFTRTGRRRYCTDACRQAAWRQRAASPPRPAALPAARPRRQGTIYQCDNCDTRYLASQWCPDCNRPCRRLGPGGHCPCGELLTIDELLSDN